MKKIPELDSVDRKILQILMADAKTSYTDIAKEINVSGGTVHVRMKKMEGMGVVKGAHLVVDYKLLGYDIVAFLGIYLNKSSLFNQVSRQLKEITEITGAHYTTGGYNIFAKIVCKDTDHLREVLHDKIQNIDGIQSTETFISLEEPINRSIKISVED